MKKAITILGSTGTIGVNTLDVIKQHDDRFSIFALTANTNATALLEQCRQWNPKFAVMVEESACEELERQIRDAEVDTQVLFGQDSLNVVVTDSRVDYVMAGIVGAAGLLPNLSAARAGKRVMLANKESLVMSGKLFMDAVRDNNALLLPIDSEHNAIFQCMPSNFEDGLMNVGVTRILLTASGGPLRTLPLTELVDVTPEQACAHPNWVMGRKISVDSATMMNKGLEVIEACWLFGTSPDQVEVVIHPQSVIHSMVEYVDGSVLAQLGNPDMRTPIAYSLAWPDRCMSGVETLNLFEVRKLDFEKPDYSRYPCLGLAKNAMEVGGTGPAILNAANEVAVDAFLQRKVPFTRIPELVEYALERVTTRDPNDIETILEDDKLTREVVRTKLGGGAE